MRLGAITPLGVGIRRTWSRLLAGESGITSVASREPRARWQELTSTVAGVVPRGKADDQWTASDWLTSAEQRRMSAFTQYAIAASEMALKDAGWDSASEQGKEATGVCLGSGIGNLEEIYETSLAHHADGYKKVSPLFVPKILINMAAGHIAMRHGFQGPNHAATTACTTGAHSIGDASRFIALGDADVMVAGGSESCIHPLTFAGFGRARSLSTAFNDNPTGSCRPFDADRNGFVVSEGAAVCVLEELEHAKARGARIYAEVRGYGCSGDAYHMTAPREDGNGAFLAMRRALKNAQIRPSQVDYINAHATGTQVGDVAEAAAIRRLMLGEGGVSSESQVTGVVPATLNLEKPDVGIDFNFVPLEAQEKKVNVAVTNSFGFGGTNSSLARTLVRSAVRAGGAPRAPARAAAPAIRSAVRPLSTQATHTTTTTTTTARATMTMATPRLARWFSSTSARRVLGMGGLAESYRVLGASERLYKTCSKAADYHITEEERKNDQVEKLEDGEELGHAVDPENVWHKTFKLQPSFSTWSHVTMLQLYLVNARLRMLDRDAYRNWQQQLVDHFFFECEKKMHLDHGITSAALRQRYLKDIFVQWRGLLLAYDEGLIKGDAVLASAVWRNLFKGDPAADPRALLAIVGWMRSSLAALEAASDMTFVQRAQDILAKPVDVFWTRLEEPFKRTGASEEGDGGEQQKQQSDPAGPAAA
ncbi:3-oxo-5-alpha-steroid 4-dehydrogenase [Purpureocillium lavendulum]|uniref:beta-ketoacyl-[acyl-carrier-protein] synthase I n=1 Tax=Purpureocillium lavendulum TaxID=1247861 RepID=A0AB34G570_9HYPO|nr:3-oxo-5-alpha-steroid 4-dehydrogenase [Purpureocillium lavendulum]